ncbi:unnamed protein product [Vitrella brassicaformis CCMP3155]|uniref:Uncharacterized protein n=2 Tax=Vitrella brassicaformis TaxID=1169539 RepID=A0A0G4EJ60_VITBC|nr:unnamed protein product [Vitrella brassicaformis CCMP3155]|eukprot:CEL96521.1 unnamed protein product [Vitrella brassicaformis CCMP3155]
MANEDVTSMVLHRSALYVVSADWFIRRGQGATRANKGRDAQLTKPYVELGTPDVGALGKRISGGAAATTALSLKGGAAVFEEEEDSTAEARVLRQWNEDSSNHLDVPKVAAKKQGAGASIIWSALSDAKSRTVTCKSQKAHHEVYPSIFADREAIDLETTRALVPARAKEHVEWDVRRHDEARRMSRSGSVPSIHPSVRASMLSTMGHRHSQSTAYVESILERRLSSAKRRSTLLSMAEVPVGRRDSRRESCLSHEGETSRQRRSFYVSALSSKPRPLPVRLPTLKEYIDQTLGRVTGRQEESTEESGAVAGMPPVMTAARRNEWIARMNKKLNDVSRDFMKQRSAFLAEGLRDSRGLPNPSPSPSALGVLPSQPVSSTSSPQGTRAGAFLTEMRTGGAGGESPTAGGADGEETRPRQSDMDIYMRFLGLLRQRGTALAPTEKIKKILVDYEASRESLASHVAELFTVIVQDRPEVYLKKGRNLQIVQPDGHIPKAYSHARRFLEMMRLKAEVDLLRQYKSNERQIQAYFGLLKFAFDHRTEINSAAIYLLDAFHSLLNSGKRLTMEILEQILTSMVLTEFTPFTSKLLLRTNEAIGATVDLLADFFRRHFRNLPGEIARLFKRGTAISRLAPLKTTTFIDLTDSRGPCSPPQSPRQHVASPPPGHEDSPAPALAPAPTLAPLAASSPPPKRRRRVNLLDDSKPMGARIREMPLFSPGRPRQQLPSQTGGLADDLETADKPPYYFMSSRLKRRSPNRQSVMFRRLSSVMRGDDAAVAMEGARRLSIRGGMRDSMTAHDMAAFTQAADLRRGTTHIRLSIPALDVPAAPHVSDSRLSSQRQSIVSQTERIRLPHIQKGPR